MSAIKNPNDIILLKKRKKQLENEASDYEFGFEPVPQKKKRKIVGDKTQNMILVPLDRNRLRNYRRHKFHDKLLRNPAIIKKAIKKIKSKQTEVVPFDDTLIDVNTPAVRVPIGKHAVETRIFPGIGPLAVSPYDKLHLNPPNFEKTIKKLKPKQTEDVLFDDTLNEVNTPAAKVPIRKHEIDPLAALPYNVFSGCEPINTSKTIEFDLESGDDDDNTLIQHFERTDGSVIAEEPAKLKEPILFSNNYFNVMEKSGDSIKAMCASCGYDENNKPKQIISAHTNVSSNFIKHLRVKCDIIFLKNQIVIFIACFFRVAQTSH